MTRLVTLIAAIGSLALSTDAAAQTRSSRTAYGAPLTARGTPADQNESRIDNRVNNRIDNRLSLRIERYHPEATANPTAAFQTKQDDKVREAPVMTPQQPNDDQQ